MERERFKAGDILCHFKRDMCTEQERQQNKYLYEVIGIATHTETKEEMLVYKALYAPFGTYVRPLEMAMSKTDKEKYPEATQEYRLEVCHFF